MAVFCSALWSGFSPPLTYPASHRSTPIATDARCAPRNPSKGHARVHAGMGRGERKTSPTDALRARAPTAPAKGAGVQRQRPARGAAPRSSKSSAVHGHAKGAAQTASIAPPPGTARARPPIHPTHSGDSPSDNDTHPARPRPPRRGPRRRNHTAQRARVRRRRRPTPRAVLLPAARAPGSSTWCARLRAGAPPGWTCARSSSSGQSPRVQWNERARPPERCPRHRAERARVRPMSAPLVRLRTDTRPTFTETEDVEPRASPAPPASPAAATDRGATQTP